MKSDNALSVADFTHLLKQDLETRFKHAHVIGEVSNLSRPASGHVYFTLKDDRAALSCVMWRSTVSRGAPVPQHGDLVEIKGALTLYEKRGTYQVDVRSLRYPGIIS